MSIRLAVARQREDDREAVENAARGHDDSLSAAHRLAASLADVVMTQPGQLDDALVAELQANFTPAQLVEITLKTMKFNIQKVMVALGTDETITRVHIGTLSWNQDGTYVVADDAP
jgi:alkylhydroperoxidase family enzyme